MPVQTQVLSQIDGITPVSPSGLLPAGAITAQAGSGNVAAAVATATIAAVAGKTNYLSGFLLAGAGATAASVILVTITGLLGGAITIPVAIPAGATAPVWFPWTFPTPLAASAPNVAIVVSAPSFGAGNTNAAAVATGYAV